MFSHATKCPRTLLCRGTIAVSWAELQIAKTFVTGLKTAIKYVIISLLARSPISGFISVVSSRMRHGIVKCSQIKSVLNCFHVPSVSSLPLFSLCVCDYLRETGVLEMEQSRIRQLYLILQSSLPSYAEPCDTHAARC